MWTSVAADACREVCSDVSGAATGTGDAGRTAESSGTDVNQPVKFEINTSFAFGIKFMFK